ncbi:hypothetical protein SAMN05444392_103171 [Seinonella peptonophila]|uniref:Uncharacterized protein n=1 Tax=Seinonella peptonophila TaxID=112248 RepID=A0A1M4WDT6_9BACL|nr:hypothetical protein [Seinonella peptonophila]SHE79345.1 hypothetical protein SAMN05444392_103171 [Seinonella peptonophila]
MEEIKNLLLKLLERSELTHAKLDAVEVKLDRLDFQIEQLIRKIDSPTQLNSGQKLLYGGKRLH